MAYEEESYYVIKKREGLRAKRYFERVLSILSKLIKEGKMISGKVGDYEYMVRSVVEKLRDVAKECAENLGTIDADLETLEDITHWYPEYYILRKEEFESEY